uniref:Ig-like domain-containing protein n=1 Tax=Haplochromis burtoni TaxID=8153 RepID=A0A3Q2VQG3_HAPBU
LSTPSTPTVFPLIPCGSKGGDMVTIGCLATGFNSPLVTFSWKKAGSTLTDFTEYPAVQKGNVYTGVSQLQVSRNEWDSQQNFQCVVTHNNTDSSADIKKPCKTN